MAPCYDIWRRAASVEAGAESTEPMQEHARRDSPELHLQAGFS